MIKLQRERERERERERDSVRERERQREWENGRECSFHTHTRTHVETQMTALQTMPQCCQFNGSDRCVSCVCSRSKKDCTNCLPSKRLRCECVLA